MCRNGSNQDESFKSCALFSSKSGPFILYTKSSVKVTVLLHGAPVSPSLLPVPVPVPVPMTGPGVCVMSLDTPALPVHALPNPHLENGCFNISLQRISDPCGIRLPALQLLSDREQQLPVLPVRAPVTGTTPWVDPKQASVHHRFPDPPGVKSPCATRYLARADSAGGLGTSHSSLLLRA